MDEKASGLISYEEGKGYEGYSVDFSDVSSLTPFTGIIAFSSKQAGALAQTIFYGQTGGKVKIGEKKLPVELVQTDFLNIAENGSAENLNMQIGTTAVILDHTRFIVQMIQFQNKGMKNNSGHRFLTYSRKMQK